MITLQELSLKEVFEIRDALQILDKYGYANEQLKQEVNEVITDFRDGDDR
jgi:hypothetical protein